MTISIHSFFEHHADYLQAKWLCGEQGGQRPVPLAQQDHANVPCMAVNFFNVVRPARIQVIADKELAYLERHTPEQLRVLLRDMFQECPPACILLANQPCPPVLHELAERFAIPVLHSHAAGHVLVGRLQKLLARLNANKTTLHGVFMDVLGMGVLIMGDSGCGKSELALELISRGHRLVADDAPEFVRVEPNDLRGHCPHGLGHFLEVRGLGVLNIKKMYGENSIKPRKYLHLIVRLVSISSVDACNPMERLEGIYRTRDILGVDVQEILLPVALGRNLAVLVESAVRNHTLRLQGYKAIDDFSARQTQIMRHESVDGEDDDLRQQISPPAA